MLQLRNWYIHNYIARAKGDMQLEMALRCLVLRTTSRCLELVLGC